MAHCTRCRTALVLLGLMASPGALAQAQEQADSVVTGGLGRITFGGLLQVWYQENAPASDRTFRIRRTELSLTGSFSRLASWTVMIDPSRALDLFRDSTIIDDEVVVRRVEVNQGSRIFQDAYLRLDFGESFQLDAGQRKVPLSREGLQSAARLKTVERALMFSDGGRGGNLGDVRDIGVMAHGSLTEDVDYQVGVFNGLGETQSTVAAKDVPAVAARVVVRPGVPGLEFGASGGVNGRLDEAERRRLPFGPRSRVGVDAYFARDRWTVQSELMVGRDDGRSTRLGTYALAAYRFTPLAEGVARIDYFDPNTSRDGDRLTVYELDFLLGANFYLLEEQLKFQANAVAKTFGDDGPASRLTLLLNLQASW